MKKIFRMALVFALAGATLMYTGCTKDYSEDINKLDSELSALENDLAGVKSNLDNLQSAVSSLQAADAALQKLIDANANAIKANADAINALKDKADALEKALGSKADKDWAESEIAALKAEITEQADALQAQIDELKEKLADDEEKLAALEEAQDELDNAYAILSNELRSLVFVPDFYFAGIEATEYGYANFQAYNVTATTVTTTTYKNYKDADAKFAKGAKVGPIEVASEKLLNPVTKKYYTDDTYFNYTEGQEGKAIFDLNPSSFPVDSAEWSLNYMDRTIVNIVKGEEEREWAPKVVSVEGIDGQVAVTYQIENPDLLNAATAFIDEITFDLDKEEAKVLGNAPVIQLVATLGDDKKTIASDWAAVLADEETLETLAFAEALPYKTEMSLCNLSSNDVAKDLYPTAKNAVENVPSVKVVYNGGPKDLNEIVNIHMNTGIGPKELTLAEFSEKYPGFKMNFELVPYKIGNYNTEENKYGELKDGIFTPCFVNESGKAQPIAAGSTDGISSVGRLPLVLVTLVEPNNGKVVLAGYFVIEIIKEAKEPRWFELPSFGTLPFICRDNPQTLTWDKYSYFVLEKVGMKYEDFIATYEYTEPYGYELLEDSEGNYYVDFVPVKDGILNLDDPKFYGEVTYERDATGGAINDEIVWKVNSQRIGEGTSKTIYMQFKNKNGVEDDVLYFALTADIAKAAAFDFGNNKINSEWFTDVKGEQINTAHVNTELTRDDGKGSSVTNFFKDLNKLFQVNYTLTADTDPVYSQKNAQGQLVYGADVQNAAERTFTFSAEQPKINGVQFYTNIPLQPSAARNNPYTLLYVAKPITGGGVENEDVREEEDSEVTFKYPKYYESNLIATIDPETGVITYATTDKAKEFLNLWSHKESDDAKKLYANVDVAYSYGTTCYIPSTEAAFYVRFVRPLDVNVIEQTFPSKDGVDGGANVSVAKSISSIVAWNETKIIKPIMEPIIDPETKKEIGEKETGKFEPAFAGSVNLFDYYKITDIILDFSKTQINNYYPEKPTEWVYAYDHQGAFGPEPGMKTNLNLAIGKIDKYGDFKESTKYLVNNVFDYDLTKEDANLASFNEYVINYDNEHNRVNAFDIRIPLSLKYAWGNIDKDNAGNGLYILLHVEGTN